MNVLSGGTNPFYHLNALSQMMHMRLQHPSTLTSVVEDASDSYLFHTVASSTVNFDGALARTSLAAICHLFDMPLAKGGGNNRRSGRILGIPAIAIRYMLSLSVIRHCLLAGNEPSEAIAAATVLRKLTTPASASTHCIAEWPAAMFFLALQLYETALVPRLHAAGHLDQGINFQGKIQWDAIRACLDIAADQHSLDHTLAWPLFIIQLAARDSALAGLTRSCLDKMQANSCVESVARLSDAVTASRSLDRGLAVLFDAQALEGVIF